MHAGYILTNFVRNLNMYVYADVFFLTALSYYGTFYLLHHFAVIYMVNNVNQTIQ